jgi:hypothetical protein
MTTNSFVYNNRQANFKTEALKIVKQRKSSFLLNLPVKEIYDFYSMA